MTKKEKQELAKEAGVVIEELEEQSQFWKANVVKGLLYALDAYEKEISLVKNVGKKRKRAKR